MPTVSLVLMRDTPVFTITSAEARFQRVFGQRFNYDLNRYEFPAYPPFGQTVVKDLTTVAKDLTWTADAENQRQYLLNVDTKIASCELPALSQTAGTTLYKHQKEGLAHLYYNPRYALLYDPGLGKTKIILDLLRLLPNQRALILTPKITVQNWRKEAERHAPNLRVATLDGSTKQKREIISRYKDYDVIVASYNTARLLAGPQLTHVSAKLILAVKAAQPQRTEASMKAIARAISVLSSQEEQSQHILAWAWGMQVATLERNADAIAKSKPTWLEDVEYDVIVADESQRIKEGSSQQTQAAIRLSKKAGRRYLSSGTAILGDPRDIFPQMKFLSPSIIPESWLQFSDTYLVRAKWNNKIVTGFKNLDLLNARIQRLAISRKKEDCLDLPPRQVIDVSFALSAAQIKVYNELVADNMAVMTEAFENPAVDILETQSAITRLNKLNQIASGFMYMEADRKELCNGCSHLPNCVANQVQPYTARCQVAQEPPERYVSRFEENPRLELLEELLESVLQDPARKIILWYWYNAEKDEIVQLLERRGWAWTGPVSGAKASQENIATFQAEGGPRIWLGQEKSGIGITLTRATYMIYYSYGFDLEPYLQSIDRNYRVGTTDKVTVYRLVADGTLDTFKLAALDQKNDVSKMLTTQLTCGTCPRMAQCQKARVKLFDADCMYQRKVTRSVATARTIE